MNKIVSNVGRLRGKDAGARPMNSIVAAAFTARGLEEGYKALLKKEREKAIAKKFASETRGK